MKLKIDEKLWLDFEDYFAKSIGEVIIVLEEIQTELIRKGVKDIELYYHKDYEGYVETYFHGEREETDEEYQQRINLDIKRKKEYEAAVKRTQEQEFMMYQTLKVKYEKPNG